MKSDHDKTNYDIFLSHATADKPWVRSLCDALNDRGLKVFLDERELKTGQNWVLELSDVLARSRYMVLILSKNIEGSKWVLAEWTAYQAEHGPLNRLLPVLLDPVELPTILKPTQALDATDRDSIRVAEELFRSVGDLSSLQPDDARCLFIGRDLAFSLSRKDKNLRCITPDGNERELPLPWAFDNRFGVAWLCYQKLMKEAIVKDADRTELFTHARTLGEMLFNLLFDETGAKHMKEACKPGRPRPVITINSNDDLLLSLPWELIYHQDNFLVREQHVDLVRTTPADVAGEYLLRVPREPFKLVVNVSAPDGSGLNYEAESYRITLAMAERCLMVPTELGTLDDLVETVKREAPKGIHFSGHGSPGALQFEDDEGKEHSVAIKELVDKLHQRLPDEQPPAFFYLASCHGNTPSTPEKDKSGSVSSATHLHREGVAEVVGYFGPIADELSTRAEEALYQAIAEGESTRYAIRQARQALIKSFSEVESSHRPGDTGIGLTRESRDEMNLDMTQPFAWAQLVYYHRGPEFPLSTPTDHEPSTLSNKLNRTFEGFGNRRILRTGFIGRRTELHRVRRKIRENERVYVFQGLGGLGKSTLASQVLPMLANGQDEQVCILWCQEVAEEANRVEALVSQLLVFCREKFGLNWERVVQAVDFQTQNAAERFLYFLNALINNMPCLILYLDNLESLLFGPEESNKDQEKSDLFGQWASQELEAIWENAAQMASDSQTFFLVASVRYRNRSYVNKLIPVSPLPRDALFRLTGWFPGLQKLGVSSRARLVNRLDGHPRAVEYANNLIEDALVKWRDHHGEWQAANRTSVEENEREWGEIVAPALPRVEDKLHDNLLLQTIWDLVLDDRERRMLYRMTVLRQPVEWKLLLLLGKPDDQKERTEATVKKLRDTSLLEQIELMVKRGEQTAGLVIRYVLHPATTQFIKNTFPDDQTLLSNAHLRLGEFLENEAKDSPYIETDIEAGYHLFQAREYNRACCVLSPVSNWLQTHGRVREGLRLLDPFLEKEVSANLDKKLICYLLGLTGNANSRLGQAKKAIGYYDQALIISRETGNRSAEGNVFGSLGITYFGLSQVEKAIGYYDQTLIISRETGDRSAEGIVLGNLGSAYSRLGQEEKAIGYCEQAMKIGKEINNPRIVEVSKSQLAKLKKGK